MASYSDSMKRHLEGGDVPAAADSEQQWGRANPCPKCGAFGFLDHIDIVDRVQYEHCPDCDHKWTQTEADLSQV